MGPYLTGVALIDHWRAAGAAAAGWRVGGMAEAAAGSATAVGTAADPVETGPARTEGEEAALPAAAAAVY